MSTNELEFESLIRKYLSEEADWETVHKYAVQMEWEGKAEFPGRHSLQELHMIFLTADAKDDPQFRAHRTEIAMLLSQLDAMQPPIQ